MGNLILSILRKSSIQNMHLFHSDLLFLRLFAGSFCRRKQGIGKRGHGGEAKNSAHGMQFVPAMKVGSGARIGYCLGSGHQFIVEWLKTK